MKTKITLGQYKNLKIKKMKPWKITEENINKEIKKLLADNPIYKTKKTAAKLGDQVILDFVGYVDGKEFEGGKADKYELELGTGTFVPGFEEQLVGTKAGQNIDVNITFPEKYIENLRGKKALFKCFIHEVKSKHIPKLNDETVKQIGMKDINTVKELKDYYRKQLTDEMYKAIEEKYTTDLINTIINNSKVTLSKKDIKQEFEWSFKQFCEKVENSGLTLKQFFEISEKTESKIREEITADVIKRLNGFVVMCAIAKTENITLSDEEINNEIQKTADLYKMDFNKVKEILFKDGKTYVNNLHMAKITKKLLEWNK